MFACVLFVSVVVPRLRLFLFKFKVKVRIYITSWPPRKYYFSWPAFVMRLLTPRSRKFGYWLLLGCRLGLDAGPFVKTFLGRFRPRKQKTGRTKIFTVYFGPASQRSGVVELVRREPVIFARVENGVTKFSPKRQKTPKFSKKMDQEKQFSVGRGKTNLFFGGGYNFKTG